MSGTFLGLEIARSGLNINRKMLEVAGKNIANANTVGYTRQRVISQPSPYGMGVDYVAVEQLRELYIDNRYWSENSRLGELSVRSEALVSLEDYLQEPGDNGLGDSISELFNSFEELSNDADASEIRSQVLLNAINVVDNLNYIYSRFIELQKSQDERMELTVSEINSYANEISELNEQIRRSEASGVQKANELRDQRNNLIDKLSELVDITYKENANGTVSVSIGDTYLVDGVTVNKLILTKDKENPISGEEELYTVRWENTGEELEVSGGELKGCMDVRDGTGITTADHPGVMGIPYFIKKLNLLAKSLAETINEVHSTGYTLPNESNGNTSQTGIDFFVSSNGGEITAKTIAVNDFIKDNVYNIAASDEPVTDINTSNNGVMQKLASLREKNDIVVSDGGTSYNVGSIEGYVKEIVTDLANESARISNSYSLQEVIVQSIENKRASVSGVSLDEELSMMIQFQHAYTAAAKVMAAIDENLDMLINTLGR